MMERKFWLEGHHSNHKRKQQEQVWKYSINETSTEEVNNSKKIKYIFLKFKSIFFSIKKIQARSLYAVQLRFFDGGW